MTGAELRRIRQELGLTQAQLAEAAGMAQSEIARAEARDQRELTKGTVARIELALQRLREQR